MALGLDVHRSRVKLFTDPPLASVGIIVCQGFTWNESISAEPLPKAVGTEIR